MTLAEAEKKGALAFFGQRYPEKVRVYSIEGFCKEVCAGPHVDFTGNQLCLLDYYANQYQKERVG